MHFHSSKMEDIINRGGGNVLIRVYHSTPDEDLDREREVHVHVDGREMVVPAGTQVRLTPGESITISPYLYHDFTVEPGSGPVLLGEVSQCNDDNTDNRFYEQLGRFPTIEEDKRPLPPAVQRVPGGQGVTAACGKSLTNDAGQDRMSCTLHVKTNQKE